MGFGYKSKTKKQSVDSKFGYRQRKQGIRERGGPLKKLNKKVLK